MRIAVLLIVAAGARAITASAPSPDLSPQVGASQSLSYEARSLWVNPAALGFLHDMNGGQLSSSFTLAPHRDHSAYSLAFSFSRFGFGVEQLPVEDGDLTRYTVGSGISFTRSLFLGVRYRFFRGNSPTLSGLSSFDVSFQYRPVRYFAIGGIANGLNRPDFSGGRSDVLKAFGITIRPVDRIDFSFDYLEEPAQRWSYLAQVALRPLDGLTLALGHREGVGLQFGVQLTLGSANFFANAQPDSSLRSTSFGVDLSSVPFQRSFQPMTTLRVEIDDSLSEAGTTGTFFSPGKRSFLNLLQDLERASTHRHVSSILVKIQSFPLGLASALDLMENLEHLRKSGKRVVVYLGQAGLKEYLIASPADRIYMEPGGEIRLTGLSVQKYFLKGTLDKIGLEGELLAKGDYKSAPEMFTRKESSPPARRAASEELARAEKIIAEALVRGGRISADNVKPLYSKALFSAQQAKAEKLVDDVLAYSEIPRVSTRETLIEKPNHLSLPDRLAIVPLSGDIMEDRPGGRLFAGEVITPDRVEKLLNIANSDSRTRAIVLRVSSPGGEVLASRVIASLVEKSEKPVYVSMGDVAASGGYLISAPSKGIFASPLTYTGSIGVFLGKLNASELYRKIDLHKEIISESHTAGLFSEHKAWTSEQRAIMVRRLNQYYDEFVGYVSKHRKLTLDQTEAAAQGRVWLGVAAEPLRLVDGIGGLSASIRSVAEKEGLVHYTPEILRLSVGLTDYFAPPTLVGAEFNELLAGGREVLRWTPSLDRNPFLYWEPSQLASR